MTDSLWEMGASQLNMFSLFFSFSPALVCLVVIGDALLAGPRVGGGVGVVVFFVVVDLLPSALPPFEDFCKVGVGFGLGIGRDVLPTGSESVAVGGCFAMGAFVGDAVTAFVGVLVDGDSVGCVAIGAFVGDAVTAFVGVLVDGDAVGAVVNVGCSDGLALSLGALVGDDVGELVIQSDAQKGPPFSRTGLLTNVQPDSAKILSEISYGNLSAHKQRFWLKEKA